MLQITGEIADSFRYIPENNLETLDIYAGEVENGTDEPNGYVFAIKTGDTKYYPWSIEVVEESFKEHGAFKVAKKMYETFMKDDLGIEV